MDIQHLVNPIDIIFGASGFIGGIAAALRFFNKRPMRNAGILLQVSLLIIKMANHYFSTHPDAKEKLNKVILDKLEKISRDLKVYMSEKSDVKNDQYAG